MSQAGIISVSGGGGGGSPIETITGNDGVPTSPTANNVNIIGATVVNNTNPGFPVYVKQTAASTDTIQVQVTEAAASSNINNAGLASFNNTEFTVDGNGFVSLTSFEAFSWIDEAASFNALPATGYFVTATATATLPSAPTQGNTIEFIVDSASGILTVQANTGQFIQIGQTKSVIAGKAVSNFPGDSLLIVYRAADAVWFSKGGPEGSFTIT